MPAAWVSVKARPAIVNVAERVVVPVFAVSEKFTVPLPTPLAPDVIVTQVVPPGTVAVHGQFVPFAVMVTLPVEAVAGNEFVANDNVNEHPS